MINQLAEEYSNQPVVFLDYHYDLALDDGIPVYFPPDSRWKVIQASEEGLGLTWAVVDSGRLHHRGAENTEDAVAAYIAMIDDALTQPARAEITSTWWQDADSINVSATVKNNSTFTLSSANNAGVHIIAKDPGVPYPTHTTIHPGLDAAMTPISNLAPGETASFNITIPSIAPSDWNNVEVIVLVDYQPVPDGPCDQLQATIATRALEVQPNGFVWLLDENELVVPDFSATVMGTPGLAWKSSSDQDWLAVNPPVGTVGDTIAFSTNGVSLLPGWNTAVATLTDISEVYFYEVAIRIYKAPAGEPLSHLYLPIIGRP